MMKIKKSLNISLSVVMFFCIVAMVIGCGGCTSDKPRDVYVMFESEIGDQNYKLSYPGFLEITVPYKIEGYWYCAVAYYADNNMPTGEETSGSSYKFSKPSQYTISLPVYLEKYGYSREFTLFLTIEEPKDTRVEAEFMFETNGVVDCIENEYYKYKYDGDYHFPIIHVYNNGKEVQLPKSTKGYISSCWSETLKKDVFLPDKPGVYSVNVQPFKDDESLQEIYKYINVKIQIEIEEPEERLEAEYRFDPNGAIDYIENKYYKYEFNYVARYPIIHVYYKGREEYLQYAYYGYIAYCCDDSGNYYSSPVKPGIYQVSIQPFKDDELLASLYKDINVELQIEIVEQKN